MNSLIEIIQQIKKDLFCPVCGRHYNLKEIKLKGLFDHTLVVQTICSRGHLTLFVTNFYQNQKKEQISTNDVIDLHNALKKFDGDFQKLWSR